MAIYRMADLNIDIQNEHPYTSRICKDYLAPDGVHADMTAFPNPAEYEADRKVVPTATDGYLEGLSVYRCIARKILAFDGFVMHASVVERGGTAYAFCAKRPHIRVYGSKPFPTHALSTAISRCFVLQTDAFGFMARLGAARKTIR